MTNFHGDILIVFGGQSELLGRNNLNENAPLIESRIQALYNRGNNNTSVVWVEEGGHHPQLELHTASEVLDKILDFWH
jgi:pimeloyl-ACP methyl ester carboxylesterase